MMVERLKRIYEGSKTMEDKLNEGFKRLNFGLVKLGIGFGVLMCYDSYAVFLKAKVREELISLMMERKENAMKNALKRWECEILLAIKEELEGAKKEVIS
ncbi:hypothetical protein RUND412_000118 [Rhizina undulata]